MAVGHAVAAGLSLGRGSLRLLVWRVLLLVVAGLPVAAVASGALEKSLAVQPYFADAAKPLPLVHLIRFCSEAPGSIWGALFAGVIIAWLGHQMLTAGALEVLRPEPPKRVKVWRAIFAATAAHLWPLIRIVVVAAVVAGVGAGLLKWAGGKIGDHGRVADWTAQTVGLVLPSIRLLLTLVWFSVVGAFAHWCRVLTVADGRRRVRRTVLLVFRIWWRRPLQGPLFYVGTCLLNVALGAVVLAAWRQASGGVAMWAVLWAVTVLLQAFIWHWTLRAARLLYAQPALADIVAREDSAWGVVGWLKAHFVDPLSRKGAPPGAAGG